ncbi:MerC domain-containing protein [Flavivirga aquimarina]|uniref:MerC domain-containing protein n=1 Tax=Flavivirga aquimarina TaxID=2027862 RepID=A0ABT8W570_9FLAO|nr:MerC domain-containing protein [Flavivirga aquimarina]MDO5968267.1 MerC domain-containing protein [Flavivirga aquimarina]
MILIKQKPDTFGTLASSLCLIHCVATPFLFIAQTCSTTCCEATPIWWQSIDYIFLVISFFAIYWSTQTTSINWIKPLMWLSWISLLIVVVNEKLKWFPLAEAIIYIPAFVLIILHLYNKKYCKCGTDTCCTNEK